MKNIVKSLSSVALAGAIGLFLSLSANAQHHDGGSSSSAPQRSSAPAPSVPRTQSFTPRASYSGGAQRTNNNYSGQHSNGFNNSRQNNSGQRSNSGITQVTRQNNGHVAAGFNGTTRVQSGAVQAYRPNPDAARGSYYGHSHTGGYATGVSVRAGFTARGNTYYHYNHGYYGSYYAPRLGFSIGILPYGYYPFYYGDYQYFYSGGLFYQYDNDQYTVVEPPVGAEVKTLPSDAQSIVINGEQYYESDGVYYQPITKDDGTLTYQVAGKDGELNTADASVDNAPAAPQIGDIVPQLPPNCRKINVNGTRLFLSPDGIYYQQQADQNGNTSYKIVGLPEADGQDQPDQTSN